MVSTLTAARLQLEALLARKNQRIENLQTELKENDVRNPHVLRKVLLKNFSETFTETQIDRLLLIQKRRRWTDEDIARALTLRSMSRKSYRYLRDHMNFPLPGESTLRYWIKDINCEPGMLNSNRFGNYCRKQPRILPKSVHYFIAYQLIGLF